jgi:hypothetical protein
MASLIGFPMFVLISCILARLSVQVLLVPTALAGWEIAQACAKSDCPGLSLPFVGFLREERIEKLSLLAFPLQINAVLVV